MFLFRERGKPSDFLSLLLSLLVQLLIMCTVQHALYTVKIFNSQPTFILIIVIIVFF